MDYANKTLYLLHDDDSYEIVVNHGRVLEVWCYRNNRTSKPEFLNFDHLDEILQDRIYDKLVRIYGDNNHYPDTMP